jgi:hypothetical protein
MEPSSLFLATPCKAWSVLPAGCTGVCSPATIGESYIGCDYAPTVTPNPVFSDFAFAVAVANAGEGAATLQVTRGSELVASTTLAKGALSVLPLPWVSELKGARVFGWNGRRHRQRADAFGREGRLSATLQSASHSAPAEPGRVLSDR